MRRSTTVVLIAVTVGLLAAVGPAPWATNDRAGQVVFLSVPALAPAGFDDGVGLLEIVACELTDAGLEVSGRTQVGAGVQQVLVSSAPYDLPGIRVGVADRFTFQSGTQAGDFRITLRWADLDSLFALVAEGRDDSALHGQPQRCPAHGAESG